MKCSIEEVRKTHKINFKRGKLLSGIIYPEFFPINESETVLNVGCGDGVQAVTYKGKFKKMVGIDTPIFVATKTPDMAQGGFFAALLSGFAALINSLIDAISFDAFTPISARTFMVS